LNYKFSSALLGIQIKTEICPNYSGSAIVLFNDQISFMYILILKLVLDVARGLKIFQMNWFLHLIKINKIIIMKNKIIFYNKLYYLEINIVTFFGIYIFGH